MDSQDKSESFGKNADLNSETKGKKNIKDTPKQNDRGEAVFIPAPELSESVSTNGPLQFSNTNSLANNVNRLRTPILSGTNPDCVRSTGDASHSQMCNQTNSNHLDGPVAGHSHLGNVNTGDNTPEAEIQSCSRHRVCQVGNNYNTPSTSGVSKPCDKIDNNAVKENRKRPSSLRLNRQNDDEEGSSSDTGNDDCSLGSEDGCVYTYRGGEHLADLPSSFFSLDMGLPLDNHLPAHPNYAPRPEAPQNVRERSRESSPDMDFLEMDFDPGPSNDADSGDELSPDELEADLVIEDEIVEEIENPVADEVPSPELKQPTSLENNSLSCDNLPFVPLHCVETSYMNMPSTSSGIICSIYDDMEAETSGSSKPAVAAGTSAGASKSCDAIITHVNVRGEQVLVHRTTSQLRPSNPIYTDSLVPYRDIPGGIEELEELDTRPSLETRTTDLRYRETPEIPVNRKNYSYEYNKIKNERLKEERIAAEAIKPSGGHGDATDALAEVPHCMVWSEREAVERHSELVDTADCAATAVVNVFVALGAPVNMIRIHEAVRARPRANNAPLPRYLLSRSVAGCTAADIVSAIQQASDGLITARFFPTHPERIVSLSHWLADWICLGAVPILTLNIQVGAEGPIPDGWHHQMVFGVSPLGIYVNNPLECVSERALWPRLTSPSVVLVRTRDVLTRFTPSTDLTPLMAVPDRRFHTSNVLGQVVNVIREWRASGWSERGIRTQHVSVPAAQQAGVTVAALKGSEAHRRLMHASQLPKLCDHDDE